MILDYEPGDKVTNPNKKEWGIGQVQSIINDKVTVNFENAGKKVHPKGYRRSSRCSKRSSQCRWCSC